MNKRCNPTGSRPRECPAPIRLDTPLYRLLKAVARAIADDQKIVGDGNPAEGDTDTTIKE